ncbi:hypothetical protein ACLB2K_033807 [Fragaria x ananassa]
MGINETAGQELEYPVLKLSVHQDWRNGKWVSPKNTKKSARWDSALGCEEVCSVMLIKVMVSDGEGGFVCGGYGGGCGSRFEIIEIHLFQLMTLMKLAKPFSFFQEKLRILLFRELET